MSIKHEAEPIGWIYEDELPNSYPYDAMFPYSKVDFVRMFPVYAPTEIQKKREWVGLTDEEVNHLLEHTDWFEWPHLFAEAIEAKLKEKNCD
jgi:hypothetical protein